MKKTTKRRTPAARTRPPLLEIVNLAELGPRPDYQAIQNCFMGLPASSQQVLLHWLAYHLGSARAEHEADPLAPANFRDHCCGRSATALMLLGEARALMRGQEVPGLKAQFEVKADKLPPH